MPKRVDYIDVIKGIAIFGVVWRHTACPNWLTLNFIFFILGGFFFKRKPFKTFLYEKIRYILIPFAFFYSISYLFRIGIYYWNHGSMDSFHWGCLLNVFNISAQTDYLFVNIPLWFLLCFFTIQILYYFISYLDKRIIFVIAILSLCFKELLLSIPTPFMMNAAIHYLGFFALGNLVGKPWIEKLKDVNCRKVSLFISPILFTGLFIPIANLDGWIYNVAYILKLMMAFFIIMSVASCFNEKRYLSLPKFYGENSLTILGLHALPLDFMKWQTIEYFGESTPFIGFVQSIIVMLVMYFVILLCNRYIPFFVGKKNVPINEPIVSSEPVLTQQSRFS